jgi:hypothetical protein
MLAVAMQVGGAEEAPTPNPWLAWLPAEAEADFSGWAPRVEAAARARELERRQALGPPPEQLETEAPGTTGSNDLPILAEATALGTLPGAPRRLLARGWLRPAPVDLPASTEGDDAIPTARPLTLGSGEVVRIPGTIGDGAFGAGGPTPSGDFDCVALEVPPLARLELAVITPQPLDDLDPMLAAWDQAGALLGVNDHLPISGFLSNLDSYLTLDAPADGLLVVCALGTSDTPRPPGDLVDYLLEDPFDGSTGPGAGSEGPYDLWISVDAPDPRDRDAWALDLRAGDVVGVAADARARRLRLRDPLGVLRVASGGVDLSGLYPTVSALPGGRGGATIAAVADLTGRWTVEASAPSWFFEPNYSLEVAVERPPLDEATTPRRQRVLLDVDGASLDRAIFALPAGLVSLSPLTDFLAAWGLGPAELDPLVDAIVTVVDRVLREDIAAGGNNGDAASSGLPGDFDLEVIDSRGGDPFGDPDVLRVIVGGTIAELGTTTIGLAEAVDPGNFDTTGTAVVLLDLLSGPPTSANSLNQWPSFTPSNDTVSGRLQLIAEGIGRIAAHEAGHLLAAYHTARDQGPTQIMDRGGRLDLLMGVGADGHLGTADDPIVRFGEDDLEPAEGLAGRQDSLDGVSFDAPLGGLRPEIEVSPQVLDFGAVALGSHADLVIHLAAVGGAPETADLVLAGDPSFALPGPTPVALPTSTTVDATVRFAPTAIGSFAATLEVVAASGTRLVELRGVGGLGSLSAAPLTVTFDELEYGPRDITATAEITLTNGGPAPVEVDQIVISGADDTLFAVDQTGPLSIAAGAQAVVTATFAPDGLVGPRTALATAVVRDAATPRLPVSLRGIAHGPDLVVSPASPYFFGFPRPGQIRTRTFTLANRGDRPLSLDAPTISGSDAALFEVLSGPTPTVLEPREATTMTVRFQPEVMGSFEALLTLPTNDPDLDPFELEMAGVGGGGVAALVPAGTVDLGEVELGAFADTSVQLRNVGTLTLFVQPLEIAGPAGDSGEVQLLAPTTGFGISPGSEITVTFRFAPTVAGVRTAELVVTSDDPGTPVRSFPLEGLGLGPDGPPPPPSPLEIPAAGTAGLLALIGALVLLGLRRLRRLAR